MRFQRRRDSRLELASREVPICCLQDPLGFAPSISGRILDVSRGGAAVLVTNEDAASLDTKHELLVTAGLPGACARLKRTVRVQRQSTQDGGVVLGLQWVETDSADRYGQIQQARFEALLCQLLGRSSNALVPADASAVGRLAERLRSGDLSVVLHEPVAASSTAVAVSGDGEDEPLSTFATDPS